MEITHENIMRCVCGGQLSQNFSDDTMVYSESEVKASVYNAMVYTKKCLQQNITAQDEDKVKANVYNEKRYRSIIMKLEDFIEFDADVLVALLGYIVYTLEYSINDTVKLKKIITQLINTIGIYNKQREKINTPPINTKFSIIYQKLRGI